MYHATKYAVEAVSDALRFEVKGFGVGVTVIQPGTIRTEFAATVNKEMPGAEGPYADFNAEVAKTTKEAYEKGPMKRLGGEPDAVAKAVEKAITAKRAPIRLRVTPSATVLVTSRRLMTDGMWDRFVATAVQPPRRLTASGRSCAHAPAGHPDGRDRGAGHEERGGDADGEAGEVDAGVGGRRGRGRRRSLLGERRGDGGAHVGRLRRGGRVAGGPGRRGRHDERPGGQRGGQDGGDGAADGHAGSPREADWTTATFARPACRALAAR